MQKRNRTRQEVSNTNNIAKIFGADWLILPIVIALFAISPSLIDTRKAVSNYGGQIPTQTQPILIADQYQGDDPHGPDPHDEIHDKGLPSNQARDEHKPTDDVYGGHELDEAKKRDYNKDRDRFAADPRYGI
jgi:hypothetical protein